ncbi:MAG: ArsR/SmtB family transcription factor [Thermoleophilia bacterium]
MASNADIDQQGDHQGACDVSNINAEKVDRFRRKAIGADAAGELAGIFQIMGDPSRLRVISLLSQGELCVCEIAAALGMSQSAVSHQLRVMRMARLVKFRKEGRVAHYSLDDDHVQKLFTQGLDHIGHNRTG